MLKLTREQELILKIIQKEKKSMTLQQIFRRALRRNKFLRKEIVAQAFLALKRKKAIEKSNTSLEYKITKIGKDILSKILFSKKDRELYA